jgi:hypothetical protein
MEIELAAIVETLKEFKGMLWGQDIKVHTDHTNLTRDALGLTSDRVLLAVTLGVICPQNNIHKRYS